MNISKKRITFLAIGSRGDLNPACALAQELIARGHDVCIATHDNFKSYVEEKGIEYAPIAGNYQNVLNSEVGLNLLEGKGKFRLIDDDIFADQLVDAYEACQGSDAIIVFPLSLFGYHIAEKLNILCICSSYIPISPTGNFPFLRFDLEKTNKLLSPLNYFSYLLIDFICWNSDRKVINKFRQEKLGLAPIPFFGTRYRQDAPKNFRAEDLPILHQFSPQIIPRPDDWNSPNVCITGNYFLDEDKIYTPPKELIEFIERGEKPIYIGFGSMAMRNPQRTAELLLEVIKTTKQRVILSPSWSKIEKNLYDRDDNIFVNSSYIPFNWLFPKLKFIIHHGGSGTTALALKAGIPQIIMPFFGDQPAWGNLMVKLGISPTSIPFKDFSSQQLIDAVREITNNSEYRDRAKQMSELIRQENGIKTAADLIEEKINNFA